jgi:hypothetical protein
MTGGGGKEKRRGKYFFRYVFAYYTRSELFTCFLSLFSFIFSFSFSETHMKCCGEKEEEQIKYPCGTHSKVHTMREVRIEEGGKEREKRG